MTLILRPNCGSFSNWYYIEGLPHEIMEDWATGWYKVIVREELPPVIQNGFSYPKYRDLYESGWLKTREELEAYLEKMGIKMTEEDELTGICVADDCLGTVAKNKVGKYICGTCGREHSQWEMEYQERWCEGEYHDYNT